MHKFVANFGKFAKIFEEFKQINYPKEMIKTLQDKNKVRPNVKIVKPNFK
jgi:hypothetical protein